MTPLDELTLDQARHELAALREEVIELAVRELEVKLVLQRARAEGHVVAIEAIDAVLFREPPPEHQVRFLAHPTYVLDHPAGCGPDTCPVTASAARTLTADRYTRGEYAAWIGPGGWLHTRALSASDGGT